jgi:branched-chain amino acid transport system ATP-binding protein
MAAAAPLLRIAGVSKRFGANQVIRGLSLDIEHGALLGVIGPNGAGKTTLFGLISGFMPVDEGRVLFDGRDITAAPAHERCRTGIARTFQVPRPFAGLSAFENVLAAARFGGGEDGASAAECALEALERAGLLERANQPAASLTLLQRKQLELARAIATRPRLLLLDEVAGGLSEAELDRMVDLVRALHRAGIAIVWIEHLVHALAAVVERLVVLSFGERIACGEPRTVLADPLVRSVYFGIEIDEPALHA